MAKIEGIYALCDNTFCPQRSHLELADALLAGGVSILQLRMKGEEDFNKVHQTVRAILQLKKKYDFTFILNDFVDMALELGTDGIHVGQDDMPVAKVLEKTKGTALVGYSAHGLEEALGAEAQGAHYVALGAIFPTPTKGPGHPVMGLETLFEVVHRLKVPVVAIGGIVKENFASVLESGVAAVAMISALTAVEDVTASAKDFVGEYKRLQGSNQ